MVVPQGLCRSEKSIRDTAVSNVQPCSVRTAPRRAPATKSEATVTRVGNRPLPGTYWWQGAQFDVRLWWGLILFVPVSFVGAKIGEQIVERIPQEKFRSVIAVFLGLVAIKLLLFP